MEDLREYFNKLRHDFSKMTLDESMVDANPFRQFETWFSAAAEAKVNEANAMTVSTVNPDNRPSSRIVLLRNFDENGFVFYSNYRSQKAKDIEKNNSASLLFFWPELERQVRIDGKLIKHSAKESDLYFNSRPRESRLGAWASPQSEKLADRKALDELYAKVEKQFEGKEVPRPEWWGGYVLVPDRIEFWQGRPSRLHDRICYSKDLKGNWKIERLAP
ncbi:MAG TPA: pyridoxamine 5'-phosphate oxidase [Bacteroidia bacterium]|nr:pyridoxamine 5'-phosphate oxidase [Bacteroidia bacterium]